MKSILTNIFSYFVYLNKARLAGYYTRMGQYEKAKQLMQE